MKKFYFFDDYFDSIVLNLSGSITLGLFLRFIGVSYDHLILIFGVWWIVLILYFGINIFKFKKRIKELQKILLTLEQKNLLSEVVSKPVSGLERYYFQFLKDANRSMTQQISAYRRHSENYKEYIEQWVHDVKTPISAIQLLIENMELPVFQTQELFDELSMIDFLIEQTLYYARSDHTNKDFLVQEISLSAIVHEAIQKNQRQLIANGFKIFLDIEDTVIMTDKKWIIFIISQIIHNSIQYKKPSPEVFIRSKNRGSTLSLIITDNGIGIPESELMRIFDKGFTGKNGRDYHKASGIGLYLSKQLGRKLGLDITVDSVQGDYTEVSIQFPKNHCL